MMIYEAVWPIRYAKQALKDHVFADDPQKSAKIYADVQEALDLALQLMLDSNEVQNEAFDVGWQAAICQIKKMNWEEAGFLKKILSPHPHTIAELKTMIPGQWVWVEILSQDCKWPPQTAYYKSHADITNGESFCCGYPGLSYV